MLLSHHHPRDNWDTSSMTDVHLLEKIQIITFAIDIPVFFQGGLEHAPQKFVKIEVSQIG